MKLGYALKFCTFTNFNVGNPFLVTAINKSYQKYPFCDVTSPVTQNHLGSKKCIRIANQFR